MGIVSQIDDNEPLLIGGDFNGHVGKDCNGFLGYHGGEGFGLRNQEGKRILDLCIGANLAVTNTFFKKRDSHLITYSSGGCSTQVDYILTRKNHLKMIQDTKVIRNEECIPQHKLLVAVCKIHKTLDKPYLQTPKLKVWKLCDLETQRQYQSYIEEQYTNDTIPSNVEDAWNKLKTCLLEGVNTTCGKTRGGKVRHQETWWWNDEVDYLIKEKRCLWKSWKQGNGSKEDYKAAKRAANYGVHHAKRESQAQHFQDINDDNSRNKIFKMARNMKENNRDVIGDKCVRDDDGNLAFSDAEKLKAWKQHYSRLLNVEFPWDENSLTEEEAVLGPHPHISYETVAKAIDKMKCGKAAGPSGILIEMVKVGGHSVVNAITDLINRIISEECIPADWKDSIIINCYKGKGDATERGNYRGLKLLDQVMKIEYPGGYNPFPS
jgi:hypothetical protein